MGMKQPSQPRTGLADALFSTTQQRVLGLLFGQPDRSFYTSEVIALSDGGRGAVHRELSRLEASGLATARRIGSQKHYQANAQSPVFEELRGLVRKTVGLAEPLRAALKPAAKQIDAAFVYGSVAKHREHAHSDVDLMIISDKLTYADAFGALEPAAKELDRTVNPTVYTVVEFKRRLKQGNAFVKRVMEQPKVWIVGGENDLPA
jgi:predicted nucleotidyltransferase